MSARKVIPRRERKVFRHRTARNETRAIIVQRPLPPKAQLLPDRKELKKLAEAYAIQARELSDAAATLGRRIAAGEQIQENIREVKRLRALADQASENLLDAVESPQSRNSAA